ncbi:hypothetical protein Cde04nite_26890 [Cellulomonas denverensis]|nr:hypothetical protein Cde04nite_26890 [Cellulomonas denverensis]
MADEEGFSGGVDELWGEDVEVVDGLDAFDLGDQGSLTRFPGQLRCGDHAAAVAAVCRSSKSFGDR